MLRRHLRGQPVLNISSAVAEPRENILMGSGSLDEVSR